MKSRVGCRWMRGIVTRRSDLIWGRWGLWEARESVRKVLLAAREGDREAEVTRKAWWKSLGVSLKGLQV